MSKVHGHRGTRQSGTYTSWSSMHQRCKRKAHPSYKWYGGRGITVCERWGKFAAFLEDMGERPVGKWIDRIDSNGNYCPENCKWSTTREQKFNASSALLVTYKGETMISSEWDRRIGWDLGRVATRLRLGWSVERAITTPKILMNKPRKVAT